jgi:L-rhamnose-H+ transport protein
MNTVLGFLIISIAAIGHTVSYRPIKKIKFWSWKSSWLIYGIFAYLLFPLLGALLVIPSGHQLSDVFLHDSTKVVHVVLLGIFW